MKFWKDGMRWDEHFKSVLKKKTAASPEVIRHISKEVVEDSYLENISTVIKKFPVVKHLDKKVFP